MTRASDDSFSECNFNIQEMLYFLRDNDNFILAIREAIYIKLLKLTAVVHVLAFAALFWIQCLFTEKCIERR